ncbi:MAG: hypothetical protein WCV93_05525 [Candidatus Shapirobacteria bacterium]|jgi:hypothetical protein
MAIFVKRGDADERVLAMLMAGVMTVLGIRLFLKLTNDFSIALGQWHIAHVLFGGIMMIMAMMVEISWYGSQIKRWSTILFGVGIGFFIDEIGKFITRDNDYFFQPAAMIIYIFFVIVFFFYRYLKKIEGRDQISDELDKIEIKIDQKMGIMKKNSWLENGWRWAKKRAYYGFFKKRVVLNVLVLVAIVYIIGGITDIITILPRFRQYSLDQYRMLYFKSVADGLMAILFALGLWWVARRMRIKGINFFQYGILVNIFLGSVFKFYLDQISAIFGLGMAIGVYYGLERLKRDIRS